MTQSSQVALECNQIEGLHGQTLSRRIFLRGTGCAAASVILVKTSTLEVLAITSGQFKLVTNTVTITYTYNTTAAGTLLGTGSDEEAALDDLKDQVRTNADSQYPGPPTPTAIVNDPATETFVLNGYSLKSFTIGITSGNVTTPLTTTPPVWDPVLNKFKTTVNMPATSGTVTITIKYNYGP